MFKKKYHKRSGNPLFIIFRLILSLIMLALLVGGGYFAYKHFSGLDPLKLDPQAVFKNILAAKTPQQFISVLSSLKLNTSFIKQDNKIIPSQQKTTSSGYAFRFLLVADSHDDNVNLKKAISQAKTQYPDLSFIIGLGDYTDVGTLAELKKAKAQFDLSGLRYFLLAGDHDLWDSRDKQTDPDANFKEVFGPLYQSFSFENYHFLLIDNSDNYNGTSAQQQDWIGSELEKTKTDGNKGLFVFIHEPLFHPSSDHYMGRVESKVKYQANSLIYQLKAAGAKKVFSGDIHYFSEYEEPETKLSMVTVGSVVTDRNPQVPRFAVVSVFEDGATKVEDVEIR